jgi:hypothetical protein
MQEKIRNKLREYLKREPTEAEVANGFTDQNLIQWIQADEIEEIKRKLNL